MKIYLTNFINFSNYVTQILLFREYKVRARINIACGCYFISVLVTILSITHLMKSILRYNEDILFTLTGRQSSTLPET